VAFRGFSIEGPIPNSCGSVSNFQKSYTQPLPITNHTFTDNSSTFTPSGSFPGTQSASGTYRIKTTIYTPSPVTCDTGEMAWNATTTAMPPAPEPQPEPQPEPEPEPQPEPERQDGHPAGLRRRWLRRLFERASQRKGDADHGGRLEYGACLGALAVLGLTVARKEATPLPARLPLVSLSAMAAALALPVGAAAQTPSADLGDAPDAAFPSLAASAGPRHLDVRALHLGPRADRLPPLRAAGADRGRH